MESCVILDDEIDPEQLNRLQSTDLIVGRKTGDKRDDHGGDTDSNLELGAARECQSVWALGVVL